ncbi:hypothetical protein GCM10010420_44920 [Streptomyces glaucosporus]|uniref:DUF4349 domain-containing protein n=1 Tax=Streptomyces glaucosporus TaxID=284044 RepID=A0ABN3IRJ6_9ACTN
MFTRGTPPSGSFRGSLRSRPRLLAAAVLAAVAVAGCGAAGDGGAASSADRGAAAQRDAGEGGPEKASAGRAAEAPGPAATHIVRTASLTVEVGDVPGALAGARRTVEAAGGYVADESTDRDSGGRERSRVTLRVPPAEYEEVLEDLAGLGKPVRRKVTAEDVTDEVVDVESRIRTQKASVERVRELMDEAEKLSDVVTLESELSTRQADLESLQARLESLRKRTGMATVALSLHEPGGEPGEDAGPGFGDALAAGWDAFVTVLRWTVVVIGAVLPFAAAALLAALVWRGLSRGVRRLPRGVRGPSRAASPAPPEPVPPAGGGTGGAGGSGKDGADGGD